jgi:hypothetical protein
MTVIKVFLKKVWYSKVLKWKIYFSYQQIFSGFFYSKINFKNTLFWHIRWYLVRLKLSYELYGKSSREIGNNPKISMITVILSKDEKLIKRTIQSVIFQSYPNLEYIIVDFENRNYIEKVTKKYSNQIKYLAIKKNREDVNGIRKGLEISTGKIVNWLNCGDFLEPGALFKCSEAYRKNSKAIGWIGACRGFVIKEGIEKIIFPNCLDRDNIGNNWSGDQFFQPSCFLSNFWINNVRGINSNYKFAFGLDLWLRLLSKGKFVIGKGIWSNSTIYYDSKFTDIQKRTRLEVTQVKNINGFEEGNQKELPQLVRKNLSHLKYHSKAYIDSTKGHKNNNHKSNLTKKAHSIIFISNFLPRFDKTSAHNRIYKIVQILLSKKYNILFIYCERTKTDNLYCESLKGRINFLYMPRDLNVYLKTVLTNRFEFIWITSLWRTDDFDFFSKLVKKIKQKKFYGKIILDTMDFHFKKYIRKFELEKNGKDLLDAKLFLKYEKILYADVDCILVVSDNEKKDIKANIKKTAVTKIIPNIHDVFYGKMSYQKSKNICFIGNFTVNHNQDAVIYFINRIYSRIIQKNKDIEFHIIGAGSEKFKYLEKSNFIRIVGYVENLEAELIGYKLFVCPMTYGAGMKGKIGVAASVGVPIVTTSIGAEGFPLNDGVSCFIADNPIEFADKCNQVLNSPATWNNFSVCAKKIINDYYSTDLISLKLMELFDGVLSIDSRLI